jgi:multimeric flavodoxin WrbA
MSKKIMILNGSPRKNGNTAALIEAFTLGANEQGNIVNTFYLEGMNIHGCKGCLCGGKDSNSPCVQKDDMDKIYKAYAEADVVVLASPLYYWTLSGQLTTTINRLFAIAEGDPLYQLPKKESALLMAAESQDFEEVIYYYNKLMNHISWTNLGVVTVGDVMSIGDIKGKPGLEDAKKLGASIK